MAYYDVTRVEIEYYNLIVSAVATGDRKTCNKQISYCISNFAVDIFRFLFTFSLFKFVFAGSSYDEILFKRLNIVFMLQNRLITNIINNKCILRN